MWQWVDKAPLDYTNWGADFSMTTVAINSADGKWTTDSDHYAKPYICKTPKREWVCSLGYLETFHVESAE